jgi:hypothetical protein
MEIGFGDEDDHSQEENQLESSGQSNPQHEIIPFDVEKQKNKSSKRKTSHSTRGPPKSVRKKSIERSMSFADK